MTEACGPGMVFMQIDGKTLERPETMAEANKPVYIHSSGV